MKWKHLTPTTLDCGTHAVAIPGGMLFMYTNGEGTAICFVPMDSFVAETWLEAVK